jgi:hypothetical protein
MVNPSKANALNRRANKAVDALEHWTGYLRDQLKKQSPLERPAGTSKFVDDEYPENIELRRKDVELLFDALRHIRIELNRFTRTS